jgi:uncharacterized membrane protein
MTEPPPSAPALPPPAAHLHPRAVPWQHVFAWFEEAMRLFKRAPGTWAALAVVTLLTELVLAAAPGPLALLREVVTPLVACGLVYAAAAADRGARVSLAHATAAFRAPVGAIAAVLLSAFLILAAQASAGWWLAGINLLDLGGPVADVSPAMVVGIYAIGILASLPLTFVPFHALLERVRPGAAFAASWNAFALNTVALLAYGAASLVLLGLGIVTMGIGLVFALPLWAASSYAAWKDVFGVRDAPRADI